MRRLDDTPIDPEIAAALDAIDATLAGEPVDPRYAELAELALLVAAERPVVEPGFAAELDAQVARRFAGAPSVAPGRDGPQGWKRIWAWWPQFAATSGALAAAAL